MPQYRKRPVIIDAEGPLSADNLDTIASWCGGRPTRLTKLSDPTDVAVQLEIPTLEGTMRAAYGDYIIRGVQGEFYPCKPDIFEQTYEAVPE